MGRNEQSQADGATSSSSPRPHGEDWAVHHFFAFICTSIALRSFEAGIVSSMMPSIKSDLGFDYTGEGMIAAAPDYGIAPGSILAIVVFQRVHAHSALAAVTFGTGLATLLCAAWPSEASLVAARAAGGLLWAHACTLYPVWIDMRGPVRSRTLWLSGINLSLLAGILFGYVVGGAARTSESGVTWVHLYYLEGFMMVACGVVLLTYFDRDLIAIHDDQSAGEVERNGHVSSTPQKAEELPLIADSGGDVKSWGSTAEGKDTSTTRPTGTQPSIWELLLSLLRSVPFILSVCLSSCISGCIVFNLYFVTQVCGARGLSDQEAVLGVSSVFVSSPGPGTLLGAWAVGRLGGYTDHVVTFGAALVSGVAGLLSALLFPLTWYLWGEAKIPFLVACWLFFFTGGMSAAPLNGVAVSVVPQASHVASGLQFALCNSAKILVPQLGGAVIDHIGLIDGFNSTTVACTVVFVVLAIVGFVHALHSKAVHLQ